MKVNTYPKLTIKIRLRAPKGSTEDDILGYLERVIAGEKLPRGVEVHYLDWETGRGGTVRSGEYAGGKLKEALENFYAVMMSNRTKLRIHEVER